MLHVTSKPNTPPTQLGIPRDHGFDSIKMWWIHGKFGHNKSKWPNGNNIQMEKVVIGHMLLLKN